MFPNVLESSRTGTEIGISGRKPASLPNRCCAIAVLATVPQSKRSLLVLFFFFHSSSLFHFPTEPCRSLDAFVALVWIGKRERGRLNLPA